MERPGASVGISYLPDEKDGLAVGVYGWRFSIRRALQRRSRIHRFPFVQTVTQATLNNITPAVSYCRKADLQPVVQPQTRGWDKAVFTVDRHLGFWLHQQWNLAFNEQ